MFVSWRAEDFVKNGIIQGEEEGRLPLRDPTFAGSLKSGSLKLDPHRKRRSLPPAMEYLAKLFFCTETSGRISKKVWTHSLLAREYLECVHRAASGNVGHAADVSDESQLLVCREVW